LTVKAPQDCQIMADVREAIDDLDRRIVPLLAERSGYVARAGQLKTERAQVVDPARIEDVVAKALVLAEQAGMDPSLAESIYRAMIDAYIAFETVQWDRAHKG
jgi:isochorismate pyruvate lyase